MVPATMVPAHHRSFKKLVEQVERCCLGLGAAATGRPAVVAAAGKQMSSATHMPAPKLRACRRLKRPYRAEGPQDGMLCKSSTPGSDPPAALLPVQQHTAALSPQGGVCARIAWCPEADAASQWRQAWPIGHATKAEPATPGDAAGRSPAALCSPYVCWCSDLLPDFCAVRHRRCALP